MHLAKAIAINTALLGDCPQYPPEVRRDAVKLGIEALKRIQHQRTLSTASFQPLLKGETIGKV